jgi:hypothetical protein
MSVFLTPSAAYGCINLLSIVEQQELNDQQLTLLNFGPVSTAGIIDYADSLDWVSVDAKGFFVVTERGKSCLSLPDTKSQLRFLLKDYFLNRRDPWLQLARRGRLHVLLQSPPEILQLFHEAELAINTDQETINFWDELAALLRGEKDKKNSDTGRMGERLTMLFETERTGFEPKWMALESNQYGYDVLTRNSNADETPLKIETKCSLASVSLAKFHLTRFEWQTAERSNNYNFHIWATSEKTMRLAILTVAEVARHIPINQNGGSWEPVEIPYELFDFQSIPINLPPETSHRSL